MVAKGKDRVSGKETVLSRIRSAVRDTPDLPPLEPTYRQTSNKSRKAILEEFVEIVTDYKATLQRCTEENLNATIAARLKERGVSSVLVPDGFPEDASGGFETVRDTDLTPTELDKVEGVLTTCAVAIAQTGTIVLDGSEGQGRRAVTLVPDYHLCVVRAEQVVGLVPEAVGRLQSAVDGGRPLTFISGPSATSDIELSRVEGVHGPRVLDVILVEDG